MAPKNGASKKKEVWMVLVCGLPGSGKTTVRQRLVDSGWGYVSQDEMGSIEVCEKALLKVLKAGKSCVVDRCNVTVGDRRMWLQKATAAVDNGTVKGINLHIEAVWMATPVEVCKERAEAREQHETLAPESAAATIDGFCRWLRPPQRTGQEPYEAVHIIANDEHLNLLLQRYADPAAVDTNIVVPMSEEAETTGSNTKGEAVDAEEGFHEESNHGGPSYPIAGRVSKVELFILRHGERADKAAGRDGGWPDDPPLTSEGRDVARRAGMALRGMAKCPWAPVVYSSPFHRCLQTAGEVAAELGVPVSVEPGLSELCNRRLFDAPPMLRSPEAALTSSLARCGLDTSRAPVQSSLPAWPEHGGEANKRVLSTAEALARRHPGHALCLVCHQHSLVELTRKLPLSGACNPPQPGYCALTHILPNGAVAMAGDCTYLRAVAKGAKPSGGGDAACAAPSEAEPDDAGSWLEGWRWEGS